MHVVTGLQKLFKVKKAHIKGEEVAKKGVWEGVNGEGQRGGVQEGSDGSMGCRKEGRRGRMGDGGMGCAGMQNEEISKETVGAWGGLLTIYMV
jgi:hypothetical protein